MTHEEKAIALDDIELHDKCQARVALDPPTVDTYADLLEDDVDLGPLDVFEVDGVPYLTDGWHRLAACRQIGKSFVRVRIVGSSTEIEDATKAALSANHKHGLRRTRADSRRCVRLALEAGLYDDLGSERAMATDLGVSEGLVRKVRAEWEAEQTEDSDQVVDGESTDSGGVQPERKPKKAKPSPFEAFRKNVQHVGRDVPKFYLHGSEVHEAAQRFVTLVRENEPDVAEVM
jgi:uncharacterized ParB-like nuclease family protein